MNAPMMNAPMSPTMALKTPVHGNTPAAAPVIPESAPFTPEQRAWLNGFFAALLGAEQQPSAAPAAASGLPPASAAPLGDSADAPWRDPALPLEERLRLADGQPLGRRLQAALAQQDCGQCGYDCASYARKMHRGEETRLNLCRPGGKPTRRALKTLLDESAGAGSEAAPPPQEAAHAPAQPAAVPAPARFLGARRLTAPGAERDVWHVELDLAGTGLSCAAGDSLGVTPCNDPELVDALLAALGAPAAFPIGGKTLRDALIEDYALAPAPDSLFEMLSYVTGGERRAKARQLAKGEDPDGDAGTLDVLGAILKFAPVRPDPEALVESLEPLRPRLYSLSSSPRAHGGTAHLTVATVRYEAGGRLRKGVASTFLAERLRPGAGVPVFVQKAHDFAPPANDDAPLIMVGPGTGVAPFRAFLHDRAARGAAGRTWLFFGAQRRATGFLYEEELADFLARGVLTKLSTAFSRDQAEKIYVQDRMREEAAGLWSWIEAGAHLYVCGDASRMAADVDRALHDVVAGAGGLGAEGASRYVKSMKEAGRYKRDVY